MVWSTVTPCSWEGVECKKKRGNLLFFLGLVILVSFTFTKLNFHFSPLPVLPFSPCFSMRGRYFQTQIYQTPTYPPLPTYQSLSHTAPRKLQLWIKCVFFFSALRGTLQALIQKYSRCSSCLYSFWGSYRLATTWCNDTLFVIFTCGFLFKGSRCASLYCLVYLHTSMKDK